MEALWLVISITTILLILMDHRRLRLCLGMTTVNVTVTATAIEIAHGEMTASDHHDTVKVASNDLAVASLTALDQHEAAPLEVTAIVPPVHP